MMWGWRHGMFGGGGLMMLLFWGAVIVGGYLLFRNMTQSSGRTRVTDYHPANDEKQAIQILKERYARGEIDGETYREMRQDLERD